MTAKHSQEVLHNVFSHFATYGDAFEIVPYGSGHINDTYRVSTNQAGTVVRYILQRINTSIFKDPVMLMDNIRRTTAHLRAKLTAAKDADASRKTLTLVPTKDGDDYLTLDSENVWRLYLFIERASTFDVIETPDQAYQAARSFAGFQNLLADLPAPRLGESIPKFHDIRSRLALLDEAAAADVRGRLKDVAAEMEFVNKRRAEMTRLLELNEAGEIPERITHNDTKINNVMLDDVSGKGICIIDLDTVMPGLALYDFGDMIRTATAAAAEDETDLSKVESRMDMFEALVRGYASEAHFLTQAEKDNLAFCGRVITFTIGVRFLTDYLAGDVYFKTKHENHNLDRARNQFKMVVSQEEQAQAREEFVKSVFAK